MSNIIRTRQVENAKLAIAEAGSLVTAEDVASIWGVTPQAVADRIKRGTFPTPVYHNGRTRLWLYAQIMDLAPKED